MPALFMVLIGCRPSGRNTEQHDVFFGIADTMKDLLPAMKTFWPETLGNFHVDAWRTVTNVNGFTIETVPKVNNDSIQAARLFFINLGGYKPGEFEEFHYKIITAANSKTEAVLHSKETLFYKHTGFKTAPSHIDDKYGIDVDEIFEIEDILPREMKDRFRIRVTPETAPSVGDELHLGYFTLSSFQ